VIGWWWIAVDRHGTGIMKQAKRAKKIEEEMARSSVLSGEDCGEGHVVSGNDIAVSLASAFVIPSLLPPPALLLFVFSMTMVSACTPPPPTAAIATRLQGPQQDGKIWRRPMQLRDKHILYSKAARRRMANEMGWCGAVVVLIGRT